MKSLIDCAARVAGGESGCRWQRRRCSSKPRHGTLLAMLPPPSVSLGCWAPSHSAQPPASPGLRVFVRMPRLWDKRGTKHAAGSRAPATAEFRVRAAAAPVPEPRVRERRVRQAGVPLAVGEGLDTKLVFGGGQVGVNYNWPFPRARNGRPCLSQGLVVLCPPQCDCPGRPPLLVAISPALFFRCHSHNVRRAALDIPQQGNERGPWSPFADALWLQFFSPYLAALLHRFL